MATHNSTFLTENEVVGIKIEVRKAARSDGIPPKVVKHLLTNHTETTQKTVTKPLR